MHHNIQDAASNPLYKFRLTDTFTVDCKDCNYVQQANGCQPLKCTSYYITSERMVWPILWEPCFRLSFLEQRLQSSSWSRMEIPCPLPGITLLWWDNVAGAELRLSYPVGRWRLVCLVFRGRDCKSQEKTGIASTSTSHCLTAKGQDNIDN